MLREWSRRTWQVAGAGPSRYCECLYSRIARSAGRAWTLLFLLLFASSAVQAADETYYLVLDSGGHMGSIYGAAFTKDGQVVSAGDDKVVRVWDLRDGKTIRTLRGEANTGQHGKILAMAMSHDGRWIATAGIMAPSNDTGDGAVGDIRLYDFATGDLVGLFRGHRRSVWALAFSPDDRLLISGSEDKSAIIWDVSSRQPRYPLSLGGEVRAVGFSRDGLRAVTGDYNKKLTVWRVSDGTKLNEQTAKDKIRALAVSPTTGQIASGDKDNGEIRIWDGMSGKFLRVLANQRAGIGALSFSPDGKRLLSTCGDTCSAYIQTIWDAATGRKITSYNGHNSAPENTVFAAGFSADGKWAITADSSTSEVHVWDAQTGKQAKPIGVLRGSGKPVWAVGFSPKTDRFAWGHTQTGNTNNGKGPLELQIRFPAEKRDLERPETVRAEDANAMVRARETFGSWSLGFGKLSSQEDDPTLLELKRSGKVEQRLRRSNPEAPNAIDGYEHDSFTFSSDGQTVISGGDNGRLIAYDLTGKRLGDYDGHDGEVWAVAASDDGRLIVSGSVDKTIRLWNAGTRELLVTLFDGPNGEWVAWTPQGYYASSPGGDRYVGWQVNHGPEHAPDFYTVRQLKEKLYRPDIVSRALALRSANEAVKEARLLDPGSMQFDLGTLAARKLPKVTVLYPPSWDKVAAAKVEIALDLDDTADPVTQIDVSINGSRVEPQNASPTEVGGRMRKIIVPIKRDLNRITIRATNAMGWAENQNPLVIFGTEKGELDKKGDLYIVAIGVNDYPDLATDLCPGQICQLNYSVADAKDFAAQVVKASGLQSAGKSPMYNNVKTKMLISGAGGDSEPTAANVRDAFDMLHGAKDNDTVVVFLAGHGMNEEIKGRQWYRFLPTDARRADSGFLRTTTVISWTELAENLGNARGARLLFVDTCHAAGASGSFSQDIAKSPYDKGVVVFSAVNQEKTSQERKDLGHGVFTMALLLGLRGEAAVDGEVWLLGFADFVSRLVKKMTSDAQVPEIKADGTANYVIARPQ